MLAEHLVPGPERPRQLRAVLRRRERLVADRVERQARRQHHAFLRTGDGDVDAPLVVPIVDRAERGDRVDHQQRRVPGGIDGRADVVDVGQRPGRGLVVHDADGLDRVRLVLRQPLLDGVASTPERQSVPRTSARGPASLPYSSTTARNGRSRPSARSPGDSVLTSAASQAPVPEEGKMMTGRVVLNSVLTLDSTFLPSAWKAGPRWSMNGIVHRIVDAIGNGRRPGDLQEMAAWAMELVRHRLSPLGLFLPASALLFKRQSQLSNSWCPTFWHSAYAGGRQL